MDTATDQRPEFQKMALQETLTILQRREWQLWLGVLLLVGALTGGMLICFYWRSALGQPPPPTIRRLVWLEIGAFLFLAVMLNVYFLKRKKFLAEVWRRSLEEAFEVAAQREQSLRDKLTGVYGRRFFEEFAPTELHRHERSGEPLSFLQVDVDDFTEINRQDGPLIGDRVLQELAATLRSTVRTSDLVFRLGGDDFLLILPGTDSAGVCVLRKRLEARIHGSADLQRVATRQVTVAIGQTTYRKGMDLDGVLEECAASRESTRGKRPSTP